MVKASLLPHAPEIAKKGTTPHVVEGKESKFWNRIDTPEETLVVGNSKKQKVNKETTILSSQFGRIQTMRQLVICQH